MHIIFEEAVIVPANWIFGFLHQIIKTAIANGMNCFLPEWVHLETCNDWSSIEIRPDLRLFIATTEMLASFANVSSPIINCNFYKHPLLLRKGENHIKIFMKNFTTSKNSMNIFDISVVNTFFGYHQHLFCFVTLSFSLSLLFHSIDKKRSAIWSIKFCVGQK